jgi:hypothetical protein
MLCQLAEGGAEIPDGQRKVNLHFLARLLQPTNSIYLTGCCSYLSIVTSTMPLNRLVSLISAPFKDTDNPHFLHMAISKKPVTFRCHFNVRVQRPVKRPSIHSRIHSILNHIGVNQQ